VLRMLTFDKVFALTQVLEIASWANCPF